jgi:hypothetical protein
MVKSKVRQNERLHRAETMARVLRIGNEGVPNQRRPDPFVVGEGEW